MKFPQGCSSLFVCEVFRHSTEMKVWIKTILRRIVCSAPNIIRPFAEYRSFFQPFQSHKTSPMFIMVRTCHMMMFRKHSQSVFRVSFECCDGSRDNKN
ncbi:Zinc finger protein [Fusarium oxysporum f. sp. albedinis]|nr:Zinc finger protein [Fusarium oxysporum f. sp. albedinis]